MTLAELQASLSQSAPPSGVSRLVEALWRDARGDWEQAHEIAQSIDDREGAWVHAYLHRKEGDLSNAGYWYARAGRQRPDASLPGVSLPDVSLDDEWKEIAEALLGQSAG